MFTKWQILVRVFGLIAALILTATVGCTVFDLIQDPEEPSTPSMEVPVQKPSEQPKEEEKPKEEKPKEEDEKQDGEEDSSKEEETPAAQQPVIQPSAGTVTGNTTVAGQTTTVVKPAADKKPPKKQPSKKDDDDDEDDDSSWDSFWERRTPLSLGTFTLTDWVKGQNAVNGEILNPQGLRAIVKNSGSFANGDTVSLYGWTGSSSAVPSSPTINNKALSFDGSKWTGNSLYWDNNGRNHYFLAVYPERKISNFSADPYTVSEGDLLVAKETRGLTKGSKLDLNFEHLTAKVVVNLHFRNQWGAIPKVDKVTLEGYTNGTVDYLAGTIAPTAVGEISFEPTAAAENFELGFEAVAIPAAGSKTVVVTIDGQDYIFAHSEDIPLEAGKITNIDLNVGRDEITLANVTISDWESQGDSIEGEAQNNIVYGRAASGDMSTEFEQGDQISLYSWTGAADEVPADRVVDGAVNTFDGAKWTAAPQMLWKDMNTEHYFLGVYPAHTITDFKADPYVLDTADQEKSDLLIAVNNGGLKAQNNPVQLTFDHAMAKLKVNLHFRNEFGGVPQVESVKLEGYTTAEVDYMAKTVTGKTTGDVSLNLVEEIPENFEKSYESIVIPSTDTKRIRISIDNTDFEYNHDTYIPLQRGKCTTLNVNVGHDEITLANVTISNWESQDDAIEGEAQNNIVSSRMISDGMFTKFEKDDQISLYGWTGDKTTIPSDPPIQAINTFDGTRWTVGPQMRWRNQTSAHYFLGVYPARTITDFSADEYVLDETKQEESDLLVAVSDDQGIVCNNRGVDLNFSHVMARLDLNMNFRNEFGDPVLPSEVNVYAGKNATVNYLTKTVSAESYSRDATEYVAMPVLVTPVTGFDRSYRSIMVPQIGVNIIDIVLNGKTYRYEGVEDIPLESGKVTTLNLNVGKDQITLASVSISDWVEGETIGDAKAEAVIGLESEDGWSSSFGADSKISLYGWTGDKTTIPSHPPIQAVNTFDGTNWTASPQMLWQSQTAAHYFLGVYPVRAITNFSADAYVLDETQQEESDLLVAVSDDQGIVCNNRGVALKFSHVMARLYLNLKVPDVLKEASDVTVKVYAGKEATVNYLTKTVSAEPYVFDAKKYVTMPILDIPRTSFDFSCESIMVPQEGVNIIDIEINGKTYRYEGIEDIPLESGKTTILNIDVSDLLLEWDEALSENGTLTLTEERTGNKPIKLREWAISRANDNVEGNELVTLDLSETKMKAIPESFMYDGDNAVTTLKTVILPETVLTIGDSAFNRCSALNSINLDHVKTIAKYAFRKTALAGELASSAIERIGIAAFAETNITAVSLSNATYIDANAFQECDDLKTVDLPAATTVSASVFQDCGNLTSVKLGAASFESMHTTVKGEDPFSYISNRSDVTLYLNASQTGNITQSGELWQWVPKDSEGNSVVKGEGNSYVDVSGFKAVYCGEDKIY